MSRETWQIQPGALPECVWTRVCVGVKERGNECGDFFCCCSNPIYYFLCLAIRAKPSRRCDMRTLPNPGRICHLNVAPKIWQMFPNVCWKVQGYNKEYKGFIDLSLICFVFLSRQWKVFKISIHFKHETSQQHFDWLKLILWQTFTVGQNSI